ncbi:MAG TPA: hypothetical protein VNR39_14860 [Pseudolabrys sp.]|nr:hypothetical protein [Pseudolabrys sp.]
MAFFLTRGSRAAPPLHRPLARRIVFTHIGKTGGNTANQLLREIRVKYGLNMLVLAGATSTFSQPSTVSKLLAATPYGANDFDIITGHIAYASARHLFANATYITILRDPRWQLISNYCSQPGHRDESDFGASQFNNRLMNNRTAEWAMDNQHTRMLCDTPNLGKPATREMLRSAKRNLVSAYSTVGFTDEMHSFFNDIRSKYNLDSKSSAPVENATGPYKQYVTNEMLEFAAKWNSLDMRLYEWAQRICPRLKIDEVVFSNIGIGKVAVLGSTLGDFGIEDLNLEYYARKHGISVRALRAGIEEFSNPDIPSNIDRLARALRTITPADSSSQTEPIPPI